MQVKEGVALVIGCGPVCTLSCERWPIPLSPFSAAIPCATPRAHPCFEYTSGRPQELR